MALDRGKARLVAAACAGVALVGVLVAIQLVDDGDGANRTVDRNAPVQVKGAEATRPATLRGTLRGADGWTVEVTVLDTEGGARSVSVNAGHYRFEGLTPGPVEISWTAESTASAGDGVNLGGQRTGRTQITLDAGTNTYDITL